MSNYLYNIFIYERYKDLKKSEKIEYDNNDLSKIFEWFSCIFLTDIHKTQFYHYDDIHPSFKEQHQLSRIDTGVDLCNLIESIVQCKLRKDSLSWKECSTFFASQNVYNEELNTSVVKWKNLIITRNSDSTLSDNLKFHSKRFIDTPISKQTILEYCNNLLLNPPSYLISQNSDFTLRPYQIEAIDFIHSCVNDNSCICIPTGTGKNVIIIHSFQKDKHYLILVPRIILMEQIKEEILIHRPYLKQSIQLIGDGKTSFNTKYKITICVYNSIEHIIPHTNTFHKIYIDEAHHIKTPLIYEYVDYKDEDSDEEKNNDEETDDEDLEEKEDDKKYISIISDLSKYNNNIYLSATIDEQQGFKYYKKDIRDMIEQGYLSDYTINIPIFEDDPTNKNICEYLIKNYKNIIIYCDSQKEGKKVNKLLNSIQKGCSEYIDCNTSRKKRNDIIKSYKNGDIPFLVNVRILVEGFDAPITKGVCFFHLPSNKTTIIQIIGRALRLHHLKTLASIILPFSNKDDEESIVNFIRELSQNDSRIKQAYMEKRTTGYLNITKVEKELEEDKDEEDEDDEKEQKEDSIDLRYELIYNSFGILINRTEIWEENLTKVKNYIDHHKKRPSCKDKNKTIKSLGKWLSHQSENYKHTKKSMKDENIRKMWEQFLTNDNYKEYFSSNEEIWEENLTKTKEYIDKHKKRPSQLDKDKTIKSLGSWLDNQITNYKVNKYIMKDENTRKKWEEFINIYKEYFSSNEEIWKDNLEQVKEYIDQHKKRPSQLDKDKTIKSLGIWSTTQITNYKKNKGIMKDENVKNLWEEFINIYKEYFSSNEEIWKDNLEQVKEYIDKHKKRPSSEDNDKDIKSLGKWLSHQSENYKVNKYIMKDKNTRKKWEEFINIYKEYFSSNEEIWKDNLEQVKEYIDQHKKRPSQLDKDKTIKSLGSWLDNQITNYKGNKKSMKEENIKKKWEDFIQDDKYKQYFK